MNPARNLLLWCSQNKWMRENIPQLTFVKRAVKKFMPGEEITDAIREAERFKGMNIGTVFTHLGENIIDIAEAEVVTNRYLHALRLIHEKQIPTEVSLKLTQLGLDLSFEAAFGNFKKIAQLAKELNATVWIDIEQSSYVDSTIRFYKEIKKDFSNVGLCLQSYLYRTESDLKNLLPISPMIRLVKGAYNESATIAFPKKIDNDENYFALAKILIDSMMKDAKVRAAFGTHDLILGERITEYANAKKLSRERIEFQMLYGIKTEEQKKLAQSGYRFLVLISYGSFWYPWYVRRLAERPANVWFVFKNLFSS